MTWLIETTSNPSRPTEIEDMRNDNNPGRTESRGTEADFVIDLGRANFRLSEVRVLSRISRKGLDSESTSELRRRKLSRAFNLKPLRSTFISIFYGSSRSKKRVGIDW